MDNASASSRISISAFLNSPHPPILSFSCSCSSGNGVLRPCVRIFVFYVFRPCNFVLVDRWSILPLRWLACFAFFVRKNSNSIDALVSIGVTCVPCFCVSRIGSSCVGFLLLILLVLFFFIGRTFVVRAHVLFSGFGFLFRLPVVPSSNWSLVTRSTSCSVEDFLRACASSAIPHDGKRERERNHV